jgi:neutral trehalase
LLKITSGCRIAAPRITSPIPSIVKEHIDNLWPVLTREPQDHIPWSSLLALPQSYIVPGGRFSETYYWDSYFTMLGLAESGREDLLKCMADNFAWMIEIYGHIPNGNRTYYLSRSQPPVFALMVELFEEDGVRGAKRYLDHLKMEYSFWMDGAESLIPNQAYRHVVRMPDGSLLNRYWDDRDTPRDESWREDVETAKHSGRPPNEVYRDLRAGRSPAGTTPAAGCGYHPAGEHPYHPVYPHRFERLPVQAGEHHRQPLRPEGRPGNRGRFSPEGQRAQGGGNPLSVG